MKKRLIILLIMVISLRGMEEQSEIRQVAILSYIKTNNQYSDDWENQPSSKTPIQHGGKVSFLTFNPYANKSITTNTDIETTGTSFNLSTKYFKKIVTKKLFKPLNFNKKSYNINNYSINGNGFHSGNSIGLAFLLMHFLNHFPSNDIVIAATGALSQEPEMRNIHAVDGFLEKHAALIELKNAYEKKQEEKNIYFFYPSENDNEIPEKKPSIQYLPIFDISDLSKTLNNLTNILSNKKNDDLKPIALYIKPIFYEKYLDQLVEKINGNKTQASILIPQLLIYYSTYRYSISSESKKKHAIDLSNLLKQNYVSLNNKKNIVEVLIDQYGPIDTIVFDNLIHFSIKNKNSALYRKLLASKEDIEEPLDCSLKNKILTQYISEDEKSKDEKIKSFIESDNSYTNIENLIEKHLEKNPINIDSFQTELIKIAENDSSIKTNCELDKKITNNNKSFIIRAITQNPEKNIPIFFSLEKDFFKSLGNNKKDIYGMQIAYQYISRGNILNKSKEADIAYNYFAKETEILRENFFNIIFSPHISIEKQIYFIKNKYKTLNILDSYMLCVNLELVKRNEFLSNEEIQTLMREILLKTISTDFHVLAFILLNYELLENKNLLENNKEYIKKIVNEFSSEKKGWIKDSADREMIKIFDL